MRGREIDDFGQDRFLASLYKCWCFSSATGVKENPVNE